MSYICYHHNDMDGKAAGNEVYKYLTKSGIKCFPSMFIQRGYDEPFNEMDYNNKTVFIVDLSFTEESIKKLFAICEGASSVTWLDHHASSADCIDNDDIRKKLDSYSNLSYFVNQGACGAMLAYLWFNNIIDPDHGEYNQCLDYEIRYDSADRTIVVDPDAVTKTIIAPVYLRLVDKWDRWVYGDDNDPVFFNFGTGIHNTALFAYRDKMADTKTYNDRFWNAVMSTDFIKSVISEGMTVKKYIDSQAIRNCAANGYECNIKGHKAFVLNSDGNSMMAGNMIDKYDLICLWHFCGKTNKFVYSLYSNNENVNCAKIATSIESSGGGHPGAAGFSTDELIFKKS